MSDLKKVHLNLPASTEDLRALEIGSVVYLTGRLFTAREGVYKHAIEEGAGMPGTPEEIGTANFHCSPAAVVEPDGRFNVGAVTATASFRFAKWLDGWFKISGCNIIIGKGGSRLRQVGAQARTGIEQIIGHKVFLDLHVKVAKDWQRDPKQLQRLGF